MFALTCWSAAPKSAVAQALDPLRDVVQLAAGGSHTCVLTRAGGVACWGNDDYGQLGDGGSVQSRSTPVAVSGLSTGVARISAGANHTCALTTAGAALCWGLNDFGQLGDASGVTVRRTPVAVSGLGSGVVGIDAAETHTCAVTSAGAAMCWGGNRTGQLGDGTTTDRLAPVAVTGLGTGVSAVATGISHITSRGGHSCALMSAGSVRCWGDNTSGQLGDGTTTQRLTPVAIPGLSAGLVSVTAGGEFTCALSGTGAVSCWGRNSEGELGDGSTTRRQVPTAVIGLSSGVSAIATGFYHACALSASGVVRCWGQNTYGALGDGSTTNRLAPVVASALSVQVTAIATGGINVVGETGHSCAVTAGGGVQCWGQNVRGQLGDGSLALRLTPVSVVGIDGLRALSAGELHSCGLTQAGAVRCWGSNAFGQLGDGSTVTRLTPVAVPALSAGVLAISAGGSHSCAISAGGAAMCWGKNIYGQLGDGTTTQRNSPVPVTGLQSGVVAIVAGPEHSCAITSAGSLLCWGYNGVGTLGEGTIINRLVPTAVSGLGSGVTAVTAGTFHTCALTSAGAVRCWGANSSGQLGDGTTTARLTPVGVTGLSAGVSVITAGGQHSCALASDGAARCWGSNFARQLGDGTNTTRLVPTPVAGLPSALTALDAGNAHTCGLDQPGALRCWGSNFFGELGDGTTRIRSTPAAVSGLGRGVIAITGGGDFAQGHTCAVSSAGAAFCWGSNDIGQLGAGGRNYAIPADVVVESFFANGNTAGNQPSAKTATDAAGRYLVFQSRASTLLPGDTNGSSDIYRRDTQTNAIVRVSVDNAGGQIVGDSTEPSVSGNGRFAVFVAPNSGVNKVLGESREMASRRMKGNAFGVYLRDLLRNTSQFIGQAPPGGEGAEPEISANANEVVWGGVNTDPASGVVGQNNVFMVPLLASGDGLLPGLPECLTCFAFGPGGKTTAIANGGSGNADVSADGRYVVFTSTARNLVTGAPSPCSGGSAEAILLDLLRRSAQRVSPPSGSSSCGSAGVTNPSIDYAGLNVAYATDAPIKPADINLLTDIYVYNRANVSSTRASESLLGHDGLGASVQPQIAGDGQSVAFRSAAKNLEPREADNNEIDDIHVFRMDRPEVRRVSRNRRGDQADRISNAPVLNYNGTAIAFDSDATNLLVDPDTGALTDSNNVTDVFKVSNPTVGEVVFRCGME